jgi:hypothetical protein
MKTYHWNSEDHKGYFENLCSNKLEILIEMEKFLVTYDLQKLNQENIKLK